MIESTPESDLLKGRWQRPSSTAAILSPGNRSEEPCSRSRSALLSLPVPESRTLRSERIQSRQWEGKARQTHSQADDPPFDISTHEQLALERSTVRPQTLMFM